MIIKIENKSVHASEAGQGIDSSRETIVFLHGSGLSHIVWSLTEQFFSSKKFNVLSIDLPGHGNSEGPCLDSIEKIADWLEKVFVELISGKNINENDIILFCKENMAGFKRPKHIVFGELPKTSTGKIQKFELRMKAKEL